MKVLTAPDGSPSGRLPAPDIVVRQSIFYALLCAGTGASLPFLPLWLAHNGMSASQIGWILGIPLIGRAVTGPLTGLWADQFLKYRTPLIWLALISTISYGLMAITSAYNQRAFFVYLMLYGLGYSGMASITPLLDSMTMQLSRTKKFAFSWVRAAGSGAFIFANICLGYLLQSVGVDAAVFWTVTFGFAVCVSARFLLPNFDRLDPKLAGDAAISGAKRLSTLLANPSFLLLLAALGCLQAAHSYYYAFSTIIWERAGLSSTTSGFLWAGGVLGELLFLTFGGSIRRWLGPWNLLIVGAAAGVLRWSLMAYSTDLWLLWPLQILHSLSFVAVYLAGLELVFILVPPGYEGLGQAFNSAYASGVVTGVVTLFCGAIFERFGEWGYIVMAALATLGLIIAGILYFQRGRISRMNAQTPHSGATLDKIFPEPISRKP